MAAAQEAIYESEQPTQHASYSPKGSRSSDRILWTLMTSAMEIYIETGFVTWSKPRASGDSEAIQGAIPDIVYDDPKDGKQRVVELKFHNQSPARYPRGIPTGRCAGVQEGQVRSGMLLGRSLGPWESQGS
jgi:hypothetical protein